MHILQLLLLKLKFISIIVSTKYDDITILYMVRGMSIGPTISILGWLRVLGYIG